MEYVTSSALYCEKNIWHNATGFPDLDMSTVGTTHRVHWNISPPSKTPPPPFHQDPLRSANCPSPPF